MSAVDRSVVRQWGVLIHGYVSQRPQQLLTYVDIQEALALPAGSTFNNAMSHARKVATRNGDCIGYCFEKAGVQVLAFNPDDAQLAAAIARRGKAITGQLVGYVDMLEWGAQTASDPALRRRCAQAARLYAHAHGMSAVLVEMADDLIEQASE